MARHAKPAKRARRPNPREDRNSYAEDNVFDFPHNHPKGKNRRNRDEAPAPTPKIKKVELLPRNLAQEEYIDTLNDDTKHIVFAMGPAGTGKTLIATLFAIKMLQEGQIKKIIITRPAVCTDEEIGTLPGTLLQKMAPWVIPILDVFKECFPLKVVEKMLEDEIIEVAPLAYMRGRTLKNSVVIADEMQNATPNQMKMLLTRIGENTRMIVTGDLRQHDRAFSDNGLKDIVERLRRIASYGIAVCEFDTKDVERHPIIEDVLRIYGEE